MPAPATTTRGVLGRALACGKPGRAGRVSCSLSMCVISVVPPLPEIAIVPRARSGTAGDPLLLLPVPQPGAPRPDDAGSGDGGATTLADAGALAEDLEVDLL